MSEASELELMELEREGCRRQQLKDFDWLIERHSTSAVMFPPGAEALPSLDILRAANKRLSENGQMQEKSRFTWEPTNAVISADDQMGFVYGVTKEETEDGGVVIGKFLSVWVREDGTWKVAAEIRNEN